jgi:hypothetical protein
MDQALGIKTATGLLEQRLVEVRGKDLEFGRGETFFAGFQAGHRQ